MMVRMAPVEVPTRLRMVGGQITAHRISYHHEIQPDDLVLRLASPKRKIVIHPKNRPNWQPKTEKNQCTFQTIQLYLLGILRVRVLLLVMIFRNLEVEINTI